MSDEPGTQPDDASSAPAPEFASTPAAESGHRAADASPPSSAPGPRVPPRRWLPPLAAGVLVLAAWIALGSGASAASDAADDYRSDRASWASWSAQAVAPYARLDAIAAAQGLAEADFDDALAPAWSAASPLPCTLDASALAPRGRVVPSLPDQPLGIASGEYASARGLAVVDAVAIDALARMPEVLEAATPEVDAVCTTAGSLRAAQEAAARAAQDGQALEALVDASTDEVTYAIVEGTTMITVVCDGLVGCTGADLATYGASIADSWTREFVWGSQDYADAAAHCPASIADPCTAVADAYDVRAEAEQAIADAFRAGDAAAIEAAFQQRTLDWDAAWSTAQEAIADAGGDSLEALLSQAWVEALEPVAACAQEAVLR